MALETLKDIQAIDGYSIYRVEWKQPIDHYVEVNDKHNAITFKIQDGPIGKHGVNGCQVDTLIAVAKHIIEGLDNKFPCYENKLAIAGLDEALACLLKRKENREKRGVEGTSKA